MPTSGIDFTDLPEEMRQRVNLIPAMIYHGVRSESAVLMRMNAVPRSVAEALGQQFKLTTGGGTSVRAAREFLETEAAWDQAVPKGSPMSGGDYRDIWRQLSGDRAEGGPR
jgi:hypothetical protein